MNMISGRILKVDLTTQKYKWSVIPGEEWLLYLGGAGYNALSLYRNTYRKQSPDDPEMPLILGAGALCGKAILGNRITVTTKSPLTGYYFDSNAGGRFPLMMSRNRIDQIIVKGRAKNPLYLYISDEKVHFCDASEIWMFGTFASYEYFVQKYGNKISVAGIGTAGSSQVRFACLVFDCHHHAGRGGTGYSFGLKNLKAIVIDSTSPLEKLSSSAIGIGKELINMFRQHPDFEEFQKAAPFDIIKKNINDHLISVQNWHKNIISEKQKRMLYAIDEMFEKLPNRNACPLCPVSCRLKYRIRNGKFSGEIVNGFEVSTISNLGINLNIFNLPYLAHYHILASDYGMDTTELGVVIGLAIDASQQGEKIGNLPPGYLDWGDPRKVEDLIHKIGKGRGVGKFLGQGVAHFLKTHRNVKGYIAKNLSVPSSGSIPIPDWTLGAVVSVRGGDHLKHFTFLTRSSQGSKRAQEYSKIFLGVSPGPLNSLEHKGRFVWFHENYVATLNSLGLCAYPFVKLADIPYLAALTKVYNSVYKVNLTPQALFVAGERIVQLQRAFNSREGIRRDQQSISTSLINHIGKMLNHPGMLDEYYYFRGYHPSGLPSSERVKAVNLDFLITDLSISSDNRSENSQFDLSNLPNLDEEKQWVS